MVKKGWKFDFWFWVKVVVVGFMLLFLIYPFCTLITRSFFSGKVEGFTLENYIRFFFEKVLLFLSWAKLFVSIVTTATTLVVGVPMAYLMSRYNIFGKRFIHIFIIMSLMSPPFIGAYSWIMLFGRAGFVTRFFLKASGSFFQVFMGSWALFLFLLSSCFHMFTYIHQGQWEALTQALRRRRKIWEATSFAGF